MVKINLKKFAVFVEDGWLYLLLTDKRSSAPFPSSEHTKRWDSGSPLVKLWLNTVQNSNKEASSNKQNPTQSETTKTKQHPKTPKTNHHKTTNQTKPNKQTKAQPTQSSDILRTWGSARLRSLFPVPPDPIVPGPSGKPLMASPLISPNWGHYVHRIVLDPRSPVQSPAWARPLRRASCPTSPAELPLLFVAKAFLTDWNTHRSCAGCLTLVIEASKNWDPS